MRLELNMRWKATEYEYRLTWASRLRLLWSGVITLVRT
jgi:hypothetical protein